MLLHGASWPECGRSTTISVVDLLHNPRARSLRSSTKLKPLKKATIVLLVACLFFALPASVLAHAELVSSAPADGEEVSVPPAELRLVFSERPQPDAVSVRLFDRQGAELELGEPRLDAGLGTTVIVEIERQLRPGPYTVVWSVVSEEDEHPASQEFVFGVEEPAGSPSVTAAELEGGGGGTAGPAGRFLALLGLLLVVGAAVQARWFSPSQTRMAYLVTAGAIALSGGLVLNALASATGGLASRGPLAWLDLSLIAGLVLAGAALVAATMAALPNQRHARTLWLVVLLAGFVLAWVLASKSHASGSGILLWVSAVWQAIDLAVAQPQLYGVFPLLFELARQLNIAIAAVHALAVSAWIGGLVAASVGGLNREELVQWHPRFSRFALRAFAVVALTGAYQAVLYLSSPQSVMGSEYGLTLVGKHVFVVGVLALAFVNRFVIAPALRHGTAMRERAVAVVRTEAAVGILVVGAATVLAFTPTARPPTDVFVEPEVIEEMGEGNPRVSGDRDGWELIVSRQSSTKHRFIVRGPAGPEEEAVLVLQASDGETRRELQLEPSGDSIAGEGLVLTRDGPWQASLAGAGTDVRFSLDVRAGHVLERDARARSLWDEAIAATEARMRSARMIDVLTDGLSVMLFTHHELVAPDRARLEILGVREMRFIGDERYSRDAGAGWQMHKAGLPYRWPAYGFLEPAIGVRVIGEAEHAGVDATVLGGYDPVSRVGYEIWVGQQDGLIHRLVMGLPGHYMINAYYDINQPISVEAPA